MGTVEPEGIRNFPGFKLAGSSRGPLEEGKNHRTRCQATLAEYYVHRIQGLLQDSSSNKGHRY